MSDDRYQKLTKTLLGVGLDFAAYGIDERLLDKAQLATDLRARTKQILELEAVRREKKRVQKQKERKNINGNNDRVVATVVATEPEEITVEYDVEPDEYREAFLMRTADALAFAVYSGPIDDEVIAAAKRVAEKWKIFTQTLEAQNGQATTKEDGATA